MPVGFIDRDHHRELEKEVLSTRDDVCFLSFSFSVFLFSQFPVVRPATTSNIDGHCFL